MLVNPDVVTSGARFSVPTLFSAMLNVPAVTGMPATIAVVVIESPVDIVPVFAPNGVVVERVTPDATVAIVPVTGKVPEHAIVDDAPNAVTVIVPEAHVWPVAAGRYASNVVALVSFKVSRVIVAVPAEMDIVAAIPSW